MKKIILILGIILFVNNLYSQEDDILLVSEIKQSTIINESSTLKKGFLKVGTSFSFGLADKIFNNDAKKELMTDNAWAKSSTLILSVIYGLTNRIELYLGLPYERESYSYSTIQENPGNHSAIPFDLNIKGRGIGDLEIGINYQLIEGSKSKASLVSRLTITIPTGEKNPTNFNFFEPWEYDLPTGRGEVTTSLDLVYRKITFPFSYSLYGFFKYSFGGDKVLRPFENSVSFKSGNFYSIGGSFNFLLNDWIAIANDLSTNYRLADEFNGETDAFDTYSWNINYMPSISFQFKKFRFVEGVNIPLIGISSSADPLYVIVIQYIF